MELKVGKITVIEEENDLGNHWIERIIERQLHHLLRLPLDQRALVINREEKIKDEINEME